MAQALAWSQQVAAYLAAGLQAGIAQPVRHQILVCVGAWAKLGFLDMLSFEQARPLVEAVCSSLLHYSAGAITSVSSETYCASCDVTTSEQAPHEADLSYSRCTDVNMCACPSIHHCLPCQLMT